MKTIIYLIYWFKALFNTLSDDAFCALCDAFEQGNSRIAIHALRTYFSLHAPRDTELERIYKGSPRLIWCYLKHISPDRRQSKQEQLMMVCNMPTGGSYHFPSELCDEALEELFKTTPRRIADYTCDYVLPPDYELRLVALCRQEQSVNVRYLQSYRRALLHYLQNDQDNKLLTQDVQLAILALEDTEITLNLIENCTLARNFLCYATLQFLVRHGSLSVLNKLLFNSFIKSDDLAQEMLKRFPQLKRMYDISCLRKPLYKLECESNLFWGTAAPTMKENQFIIDILDISNSENHETVIARLLSQLELPDTTPYFCAWCAAEFPETSEQAYRRVRKIAKAYKLSLQKMFGN